MPEDASDGLTRRRFLKSGVTVAGTVSAAGYVPLAASAAARAGGTTSLSQARRARYQALAEALGTVPSFPGRPSDASDAAARFAEQYRTAGPPYRAYVDDALDALEDPTRPGSFAAGAVKERLAVVRRRLDEGARAARRGDLSGSGSAVAVQLVSASFFADGRSRPILIP